MIMTVNRYALINADNRVVNVCLWDGNLETWQPPEGIVCYPIADDAPGGSGDLWDPESQTIIPGTAE